MSDFRALIALAQKQSCPIANDINEMVPGGRHFSGKIKSVAARSRLMDIEKIEVAADEWCAVGSHGEAVDCQKYGKLDNDAQIYLKQVGQIPPMTPEQEIGIARRMEEADRMVQAHLTRFGFITRVYLDAARELGKGGERFEHFVTHRTIKGRKLYLRALPGLCARVEEAAQRCTACYHDYQVHDGGNKGSRRYQEFLDAYTAIQRLYPRFFFQHAVIDRLTRTVDETHRLVMRWRDGWRKHAFGGSESTSETIDYEAKLKEEQMRSWMSTEEFCGEYQQLVHWREKAHRAKVQIVEANLRLVVTIAKYYRPREHGLLDLIQEGNIGLMKAVERFQYRRGSPFSRYATWWIRQAIRRGIGVQAGMSHIPVKTIEMLAELLRVQNQLGRIAGREATSEEIADELRIPVERVRAVLGMAQHPISLHLPVGKNGNFTIGDLIEDSNARDPSDRVALHLLKDRLTDLLATLSIRERQVIEQRFGLVGGRTRTLEELGAEFCLCPARVRHIEAAALRKMRHPKCSRQLADFLA